MADDGSFSSFLAKVLQSTSKKSSPSSEIMIISDNAKGLRSPPTPAPSRTRRVSSPMPSRVALSNTESDSQEVTQLNSSSPRRHSTDGKLSRWGDCDSMKLQFEDGLFCPHMSPQVRSKNTKLIREPTFPIPFRDNSPTRDSTGNIEGL